MVIEPPSTMTGSTTEEKEIKRGKNTSIATVAALVAVAAVACCSKYLCEVSEFVKKWE